MQNSRSAPLWVLARIAVGLFLAFAGFTKLLEPVANFEAALFKYGVFPPPVIPIFSHAVPWLEWILGSFLVLGYAPRTSAAASAFLTLGFLIVLGSSDLLLTSGKTGCGCFGRFGPALTLRQIFVIDFVNLAVLLRLAFLKEHPFSLHGFLVKGRG